MAKSEKKSDKQTPMMEQYWSVRNSLASDTILLFRLGDFYEMFYDDAILASKELELTLTGRDCGQKERAPMCGVPFHSYESYVARKSPSAIRTKFPSPDSL